MIGNPLSGCGHITPLKGMYQYEVLCNLNAFLRFAPIHLSFHWRMAGDRPRAQVNWAKKVLRKYDHLKNTHERTRGARGAWPVSSTP